MDPTTLYYGAKAAQSIAPLAMRLIDGDGSVRQRENNFAQNAENMHWERVRNDQNFALHQATLENQFSWLVEGAQKAGFNPLTVLGASGGTNQSNPGAAAPLASHVPNEPGWGGVLSDAIGGLADLLDPIERERRELENELTEKRIAQIENEEARMGQVPELQRTASQVRRGAPALSQNPDELGNPEEIIDDFSMPPPDFNMDPELAAFFSALRHKFGEDVHTLFAENVDEYRRFLRRKPPLKTRIWTQGLQKQADEYVATLSKAGTRIKDAKKMQGRVRANSAMDAAAWKHYQKHGAYPDWYKKYRVNVQTID